MQANVTDVEKNVITVIKRWKLKTIAAR